MPPSEVVVQFNDRINSRDRDGLGSLMSDDRDNTISQWRVYHDTSETRQILGLPRETAHK